VWLNPHWQEVLKNIVSSGFKALLSPGWYLDQQIPSPDGTTHYFFFDTWQDFYNMEPTSAANFTQEEEALIMGGEACQWGESANPYSIDGNVWARAAATAERLWSPKEVNDVTEAYFRLLRFQCSILQRGIRTSPFRPNHCPSLILDAMLNPPPINSSVTMPLWVLVIGCITIVVLATTTIGFFLRMRSRNKVEIVM
jgi:hexosaminidase